MNIANKLTIFRFFLVFPVVLFILCDAIPFRWIFALFVFLMASYTDYLDGSLARKYNYITDFGKIMDPLADKLLVISIFICFVGLKISPILPVVLIVIRELVVTSTRFLVLKNNGGVISANIWGKLKTVTQMVTISAIMIFQIYMEMANPLDDILKILFVCQNVLIWLSTVFSLISGIIYIWKSKKFLNLN